MVALFTHRADQLLTWMLRVLIDADLGMLAVSPQDFKRFRESLREECPDLCDTDYVRAHAAWQLRKSWHAGQMLSLTLATFLRRKRTSQS